MPVTFVETEIPEVLVVKSPVYGDERGYFCETHNQAAWREAGVCPAFVQDNLSASKKGVLRGMHYQIEPHAMGKLVRVVRGSVFDVGVDLRRGSPTFGKWVGRTLGDDPGAAMWIPEGFAHGFLALEDDTLVAYKCTAAYAPESERSLLYSDPDVGIQWPMPPTLVSDKDVAAPALAAADFNFVYQG